MDKYPGALNWATRDPSTVSNSETVVVNVVLVSTTASVVPTTITRLRAMKPTPIVFSSGYVVKGIDHISRLSFDEKRRRTFIPSALLVTNARSLSSGDMAGAA